MKKRSVLILFFVTCFLLGKSTTVINGFTFKPFVGKTVNLIQYKDFITKEYEIIASTNIDSTGKFNFSHDIEHTQLAIIQIEYLIGIIYLDPNQEYTIYFPPNSEDGTYKLTRNNVNIVFKTIPDNDINGLILEFDRTYDQFLLDNRRNVGLKIFHTKLDSFKTSSFNRFKTIKNNYFMKYVKYRIASLELVAPAAFQKVNKINVYNSYIANKIIDFKHETQVRFLLDFYEKLLKNQIGKVGKLVQSSLNEFPSFVGLDTSLSKDNYLKSSELREFVILDNLFTLYYDENYNPNSIMKILNELKENSSSKDVQEMAQHVISKIQRMQVGTVVSDFELLDKNEEKVRLSDFKGKYVYINFWAMWNRDSRGEMELIKKLKQEYGDLIEFVSINVDSKKIKFDRFVASHQDYSWNMTYFGGNSNLLDEFEIYSIPHYVLIDKEGKILSAPAKRPSPDGNYVSIDKTFFNLKKANTKKVTFKIGEK